MKKVMITGGTGFIGRNIIPLLEKHYDVYAPSRKELDLKDSNAVYAYLEKGQFDVVIHSANPNPVKNAMCDSSDTMFEDSMRIFMNFYRAQRLYGKMLYIGSGAEYDKTMEISEISEDQIGRSVPRDIYGCSKLIMNELAQKSENVYNLRLFACFGPYDHSSKFITHIIRCCLNQSKVTMRQDCYFDYLHIYDLEKVIEVFIEQDMKYHDYNIGSGRRYLLSTIAKKIMDQMGVSQELTVETPGLNREYTCSIARLNTETDISKDFYSIDDGIALQITHEREQI